MKNVFFILLILIFSLTIISCAKKDSSTTLSAPSGLTATGGASQVTLDWTAVSGASSYTVYWDNTTGVSSSSTAITSVSTDDYTHSSLDNGTTNYYKVAAVNSAGTGSLSSEVSATTNLSTSNDFSMDNLTIGSQTYSSAWRGSCTATAGTDISGERVYYAEMIKYYDNKSLIRETLFFNDSSCTNAYSTGASIVTDQWTT